MLGLSNENLDLLICLLFVHSERGYFQMKIKRVKPDYTVYLNNCNLWTFLALRGNNFEGDALNAKQS